MDDIHEYLLLKGVEAVAIHGSKDQEERDNAITRFKNFQADVLVATYLFNHYFLTPFVHYKSNIYSL